MYFELFFVLICLSKCYCLDREDDQEQCALLIKWLHSSSVSLEVSKKGFHRDVTTTVDVRPEALSSGASVLLLHRWPRGVFVDPYQLASLSDHSNWEILLDSAIDLELPAHKTSGFSTYMFPTTPLPNILKFKIPVHGRYHESSFAGETFTSVHFEPPELLLRTKKCTDLHRFESYPVVDAPCTVSNSSTCSWFKKSQQQEGSSIISIMLPVGDGSATKLVCSGTLLVTVLCSVALSKYMLKHRII